MLTRRNMLRALGIAGASSVVDGCSSQASPALAPPLAPPSPPSPLAAPSSPVNAVVARASKPFEEWVVGSYLPLSVGEFGAETRQGIECALAEINLDPPLGIPVRVVFEDVHESPTEANAAVKKLIEEDHVIAIVGSVMSNISKAGAQVADRAGVPMIATAATHPDVTEVGPYIFRACFIDTAQGLMAADYISGSKPPNSTIGLLFAENDTYSVTLASSFKKALSARGEKPPIERPVSLVDIDFSKHLAFLKGKNVGLVFAPLYYDQMVLVARSAQAQKLPLSSFVGGDGWIHPGLFVELEGAHFIDHFSSDAPWPKSKDLVETFNNQFGFGPTSLAATGYDATLLLADAMRRAKSPTSKGIRDALAITKDFVGATGLISLDEHRNPQKPAVIQRIQNGVTFFEAFVGASAEAMRRGR